MVILYDLLLRIYFLLVLVVSVSNDKAKKFIRGRWRIFKRIRLDMTGDDPRIWFHCASLGEFEQGRPVIEAYRKSHPNTKIVLTFFSPSGYEIRKNYEGVDFVYYLPLDTFFNARRFVRIVKPQAAVFVKYEFWYHYLQALHSKNIPTYVISAIFRPNQIFFRWYGGMFRGILRHYQQIFVQNQASKDLLSQIGMNNVTVSGDTRFDRVVQIAKNAKHLQLLEAFAGHGFVLIAGSTWPDDETILIQLVAANPSLKLVLVPHEVGEGHLANIVEKLGTLKYVRYTQASVETVAVSQVLIVDIVGILSSTYQYGKVAYIGGGFGVGIHNTLEAATFGMPVMFGPNYQKFQEAKDLIAQGGAFSISSYDELEERFKILIGDASLREKSGAASKFYVESQVGATQCVLDFVG